ncbi:MAG: hypothetical protein ACOC9Y_00530 [Chloroflexota bacterium]
MELWTTKTYKTPPAESVSALERQSMLNRALLHKVWEGWKVERQEPYAVYLSKGRRPRFWVHFLLTVLTAGLWLIVYLPWLIFFPKRFLILSVDAEGNVVEEHLPKRA